MISKNAGRPLDAAHPEFLDASSPTEQQTDRQKKVLSTQKKVERLKFDLASLKIQFQQAVQDFKGKAPESN